MEVIVRRLPEAVEAAIRNYRPQSELGKIIKACFKYLPAELAAELIEKITSVVICESRLSLVVIRHPDSPFRIGRSLIEDYGLVSTRVVTNNGADAIRQAFQNLFELELFNYHGVGTGTAAEAVTDAALQTEWASTDYQGGARATGTQSSPAARVYRTVGTVTKASAGTSAVTEHGIFSSATVGSGVLLDRSVFAAVNLAQNDSLQATYDFTINAGG